MWSHERTLRPTGLVTSEPTRSSGGTVLLEVIIALGLFFVTAGIVFGGLSSSLNTARRVIVKARASDLAVTKLSEIALGLLEITDDGPNTYEEEDLQDWTWEIVTQDRESDGLLGVQETQVEVIVRHVPSGHEFHLVRVLRPGEGGAYQRRGEEREFSEVSP